MVVSPESEIILWLWEWDIDKRGLSAATVQMGRYNSPVGLFCPKTLTFIRLKSSESIVSVSCCTSFFQNSGNLITPCCQSRQHGLNL